MSPAERRTAKSTRPKGAAKKKSAAKKKPAAKKKRPAAKARLDERRTTAAKPIGRAEDDRRDRLAARIAAERARDPDAFARQLGFADLVVKWGWVVIPIAGEPFAFSVGMNYLHDRPEVMILADDLAPGDFKNLINEVCCHLRDRGPIELGRDYGQEILVQRGLAFDSDPRDAALPEAERRMRVSEGEPFRLAGVARPLVFRPYTAALEEQFPCGYLARFNRLLCDLDDVSVIVADLRRPALH